ncbi:MAG: cytochrome c biogenesis protein DipZ [Propionicimonas sp.]|uniref:cytochrome c biogenesis protein DipZ n=1 Tax=Propionicimonas sp. TaxID=1955623 RepID=UPI003D121538
MPLVLIGFLGGLITGVSPCILPVLPMVFLGGGTPAADGALTPGARRRPFLVVLGLVTSFAAFTLFGTLLLSALHLPPDLIRWLGLGALVLLGLALVFPGLEAIIERPFARLPQPDVQPGGSGFGLGLALGAVFVPCAGPVLAAITVAGTTGRVGVDTVLLTVSFAVGCAVPLLVFALAGREVVARVRAFQRHQRVVRVVSGIVMIALAVALALNVTDAIQRAIPDYTTSIGNSLGSGLGSSGSDAKAPVGLSTCQAAAYTGDDQLRDCGPAPEFAGIEQWLNTDGASPSLADLKGRVVLVDFWAYSCINCQRELPHAQAWYSRYADDGFVVVGVHTPEYAFEHEAANVADGAARLGLTFPIALDNDDATWNAYGNQSWPAGYLIDATGEIRHVSIGEGDYDGEERLIRQLLQAANPGTTLPAATDVADTTPHDVAQSPEMYLGSERTEYFTGNATYPDGTGTFHFPGQLEPSHYALDGTWTASEESLTAGAGARIELAYHASSVYLDVGGTGTLQVTTDGATRTIAVKGAPNIYTVATNGAPVDGTVTIALSEGLDAYSFTFG